jgi:hypothetical protein
VPGAPCLQFGSREIPWVSELIASSESNRGDMADEGAQGSKKEWAKTRVVQKSKPGKKKAAVDLEESGSNDEEALPPLSMIDCDVSLNSGRGSKLESLNMNLSWRDVNALWRTWAEIADPMHRP